MKKVLKKVLIIISFAFLAYFTKPPVLHVYFDKASSSTLLQMVDYIQQPEKDYKIASWRRLNNHIQNQEKFKNTNTSKKTPKLSLLAFFIIICKHY